MSNDQQAAERRTDDPENTVPLENPAIVRNHVTDDATATYWVQRGRINVQIMRGAAAIRTRGQAAAAAAKITTALGWPKWKLVNLERLVHTLPATEARKTDAQRRLEVIFLACDVVDDAAARR